METEAKKVTKKVTKAAKKETAVQELKPVKATSKKKIPVAKKGEFIKGTLLHSPEGRNAVIPRVTMLFANIITSAHNYNNGILISTELSTRQVVVAAGPNSYVKVGEWIEINVDMFPRETKPGKHDVGSEVHVHPPLVRIGNTQYLAMTDRHAKWIIDK